MLTDIFYPVQFFADKVTYKWMNITPGSYLADTVNFFIYDLIKIGLLLVLVNFIMAITRYYFPMEKVRDLLVNRRWYGVQYVLAALLGVVTPFCSCSSIPLFIGFLSAGIPLGVTFAFLISSPLINESSLYIFPAVFGTKVTLQYNFLGLGISILGGMVIQRMQMEKFIRPEFLKFKNRNLVDALYKNDRVHFISLAKHWSGEAMDTTKRVFPYVFLGVLLGAFIHGYIPESFIAGHLSSRSWISIPLAVLLGVPVYANSVSIIPVTEALINKGIPVGTAIAFMTATVTLSLPEALMLKRVMRVPLLASFFGITTVGIIIMGYILNIFS